MCIKFNTYHSGGSSIVNVNDCWLLQKLFVYYRYKFSSEKKKNIYIYIYIRSPSIRFRNRNRFGFANRVGPDRGRDK